MPRPFCYLSSFCLRFRFFVFLNLCPSVFLIFRIGTLPLYIHDVIHSNFRLNRKQPCFANIHNLQHESNVKLSPKVQLLAFQEPRTPISHHINHKYLPNSPIFYSKMMNTISKMASNVAGGSSNSPFATAELCSDNFEKPEDLFVHSYWARPESIHPDPCTA